MRPAVRESHPQARTRLHSGRRVLWRKGSSPGSHPPLLLRLWLLEAGRPNSAVFSPTFMTRRPLLCRLALSVCREAPAGCGAGTAQCCCLLSGGRDFDHGDTAFTCEVSLFPFVINTSVWLVVCCFVKLPAYLFLITCMCISWYLYL